MPVIKIIGKRIFCSTVCFYHMEDDLKILVEK